jgi:[protein-PII] uridylyltransferase
MSARVHTVPHQREIIDRRAVAAQLEGGDRAACAALLKEALAHGRAEIARRLEGKPYAGMEAAAAYAFLTDQILRVAYDFVTTKLHPLANPTTSERLLLMAVGGYGRGEMALYSDVDIAFVTPYKSTGWTETVVETILYLLWDLGLKVGHSTRSVDELLRVATADQTVRTAILEARYVWGDEQLYDVVATRFWKEVVAGKVAGFVKEKLDERDDRHKRMGDSRYVVEPNVKEGKGGLRDLHALFWIGKYAYRVRGVAELVDVGLLSPAELRQFQSAERFLWAVRCHLHLIAGRAEERLTFDYQREIAARMNYTNRPGKSAVERFMRHYFLHAKTVGDLTGVFLAHLDEQFAGRGRRMGFPMFRRRKTRLEAFIIDRGRLALPDDDNFFPANPIRLLRMFWLADRNGLEIHPLAMRAAARHAKLIDAALRADPEANKLFLDILTSERDPETVLRWMNEAGVFGRFIPDFGRVVAQMQFDMYHHYTVDEHSIRAIGLLSRIERGLLREQHPLGTALFKQISSRRTLYVSVLLHDIAKGRGGDHSHLGADIAYALCPRLGLTEAETETVAWLVLNHLVMSMTSQRRDLSDPKSIDDFAGQVKSLERLRLLYLLTVVDITAVGPGTWTAWKGQLLLTLYEATEERLRLGHKEKGRRERVEAVQAELAATLGWPADKFRPYVARLPDSYWLAEPAEALEENARLVAAVEADPKAPPLAMHVREARGATLVSVYVKDQPGLFCRLAGAISLAGGNIIDARIHTTADDMALDNFLVQDGRRGPMRDHHQLKRLEAAVLKALDGQGFSVERLTARALPLRRAEAFAVQPAVFVNNQASNRYTVVEVNARDRSALLYELTQALYDTDVVIRSAHIATHGERAVDVFYLTGADGGKIEAPARLKRLEAALHKAAATPAPGRKAAA